MENRFTAVFQKTDKSNIISINSVNPLRFFDNAFLVSQPLPIP